jgi:hypothetical protein
MNKFFPAFLALAIITVAFIFSPSRAAAYEVGPTEPSSSSQSGSYDFGSSFQNLVSPFTNFFNSIQSSGGTVSISANSTIPGATISVNTQPYVNQFDSWFYGFTGIHIESFTNAAVHFFVWLFGALAGVVTWIAGLLKGIVK